MNNLNEDHGKELEYLLGSFKKKMRFQKVAHFCYWSFLSIYVVLAIFWFIEIENLNRELEEIAVIGAIISIIAGILIFFDVGSKKKTLEILSRERAIETKESKDKVNEIFNAYKSQLSLKRRFLPVLILIILNMVALYILSVRIYSSHLILFVYMFSAYIILGGFCIHRWQASFDKLYSKEAENNLLSQTIQYEPPPESSSSEKEVQAKLDENLIKRIKKRLNLQKFFFVTYWALISIYIGLSVLLVLIMSNTNQALILVSMLGIILSLLAGLLVCMDIRVKRTTTFLLMQQVQEDKNSIKDSYFRSLIARNILPANCILPIISIPFLNSFVMIAASERLKMTHFMLIGFVLLAYGVFLLFWIGKWSDRIQDGTHL